MSTHIPADHFTKPILARLGVGKGPGGKGWIELSPKFLWNEPSIVWHDNKHGIDSGARSRAFCGAIAPTCRPVLPDFGAIDCPKCLAAWDAFAADTGATVEVIPTPAEQGDDEPWGAGAADRGGRW